MKNTYKFASVFIYISILCASIVTYRLWLHDNQGTHQPCREGIESSPIDQSPCLHRKTEEAQAETIVAIEGVRVQPTTTVMTKEESGGTTVFVPGIPDSMRTPEVLASQEFADGPVHLRGSQSIWRIGAIEGSDPYSYIIVYALSRYDQERKEASIHIAPYSQSITQDEFNTIARLWIIHDTEAVDIIGFKNLMVTSESITGTLIYRSFLGTINKIDLDAKNTYNIITK